MEAGRITKDVPIKLRDKLDIYYCVPVLKQVNNENNMNMLEGSCALYKDRLYHFPANFHELPFFFCLSGGLVDG